MKTIYFAGLPSDANQGDVVIAQATKYLFEKAMPTHQTARPATLNLRRGPLSLSYRIIRKIRSYTRQRLHLSQTPIHLEDLRQNYRQQLTSADLIVVVGGGLIKYKYQDFYLYLTALVDVAEEFQIPVVFNAVGIEGYSETNKKCQLLKSALNRNIVKRITTRDDIETLRRYYRTNERIYTQKVADPAVYVNEVYGIQKQKSLLYGIGLIRGGIFRDNDRPLAPDKVVDFYAALIAEMERRDLPYQLFTNGLTADHELLSQIEAKLRKTNLSVISPNNGQELVETISQFRAVVAARLHANIVSYALNVPSVGLVWNDKLHFFGEAIGHPERFFEYDTLRAHAVVDAVERAATEGYDQNARTAYRSSIKREIDDIVHHLLLK